MHVVCFVSRVGVNCVELGMDCGNRAGKLFAAGDEDGTQLRHGCRHLSLRPLLASCTQQERHVHVFVSVSLLVLFMAEIVRLRVKWAGAGTDCGNRAGCDERQHRTTSTCCWRHSCCHPFLISIHVLQEHWSPLHLPEQWCSCGSCRHLLHYFDP